MKCVVDLRMLWLIILGIYICFAENNGGCQGDVWDKRYCEFLKRDGYCGDDLSKLDAYGLKMKKMCFETCGHCQCEDFPSIINTCRIFREKCHGGGDTVVSKFLKKMCPRSCGICPNFQVKSVDTCQDSFKWEKICQAWKDIGKCETDLELRAELCQKTCGYCNNDSAK